MSDSEYIDVIYDCDYFACRELRDFPPGVHIFDHRGHEYLTVEDHGEFNTDGRCQLVELRTGEVVSPDRVSAPYVAVCNRFV